MSLSSTSNSLKSSGTFNSNSSINSTPSVDRYAALKDLDEQLREIKEKDNHNTLSAPVNPFNVISSSPSSASVVQPNPFQATSTPLWFNEQPAMIGAQQSIHPMTNGNGIYDHSSFGLNGSAFNGNGANYQKVTDSNMFNGSLNMANGFPQKNPFAVRKLIFFFFRLNNILMKCHFYSTGSSIKCYHKSIFMNLVNRSSQTTTDTTINHDTTIKRPHPKKQILTLIDFEVFALNVNPREKSHLYFHFFFVRNKFLVFK